MLLVVMEALQQPVREGEGSVENEKFLNRLASQILQLAKLDPPTGWSIKIGRKLNLKRVKGENSAVDHSHLNGRSRSFFAKGKQNAVAEVQDVMPPAPEVNTGNQNSTVTTAKSMPVDASTATTAGALGTTTFQNAPAVSASIEMEIIPVEPESSAAGRKREEIIKEADNNASSFPSVVQEPVGSSSPASKQADSNGTLRKETTSAPKAAATELSETKGELFIKSKHNDVWQGQNNRTLRLLPPTEVASVEITHKYETVTLPSLRRAIKEHFNKSINAQISLRVAEPKDDPRQRLPTIQIICRSRYIKELKRCLNETRYIGKEFEVRIVKGRVQFIADVASAIIGSLSILSRAKTFPVPRQGALVQAIYLPDTDRPSTDSSLSPGKVLGSARALYVPYAWIPPASSLTSILQTGSIPKDAMFGLTVHHILDTRIGAGNEFAGNGIDNSDVESDSEQGSIARCSSSENIASMDISIEPQAQTIFTSDYEELLQNGIPFNKVKPEQSSFRIRDRLLTRAAEAAAEDVQTPALEIFGSSGYTNSADGFLMDWAAFRLFRTQLDIEGQDSTGPSRAFSEIRKILTEFTTPKAVKICAEMNGSIQILGRGRTLPTRSLISLNDEFQGAEGYSICVHLNGCLEPGSSGSLVIEEVTNRVCGFIIAYDGRNQLAYFSPLIEVFKHMEELLSRDKSVQNPFRYDAAEKPRPSHKHKASISTPLEKFYGNILRNIFPLVPSIKPHKPEGGTHRSAYRKPSLKIKIWAWFLDTESGMPVFFWVVVLNFLIVLSSTVLGAVVFQRLQRALPLTAGEAVMFGALLGSLSFPAVIAYAVSTVWIIKFMEYRMEWYTWFRRRWKRLVEFAFPILITAIVLSVLTFVPLFWRNIRQFWAAHAAILVAELIVVAKFVRLTFWCRFSPAKWRTRTEQYIMSEIQGEASRFHSDEPKVHEPGEPKDHEPVRYPTDRDRTSTLSFGYEGDMDRGRDGMRYESTFPDPSHEPDHSASQNLSYASNFRKRKLKLFFQPAAYLLVGVQVTLVVFTVVFAALGGIEISGKDVRPFYPGLMGSLQLAGWIASVYMIVVIYLWTEVQVFVQTARPTKFQHTLAKNLRQNISLYIKFPRIPVLVLFKTAKYLDEKYGTSLLSSKVTAEEDNPTPV